MIKFGKTTKKTTIIKKNLDPVWEEIVSFDIKEKDTKIDNLLIDVCPFVIFRR